MSLFQVLVIDEDPKFTSGVASVLQRASRETGRAKGLVVLRATDVKRAFEVLSRDPIRMVFLSAELKGKDPLLVAQDLMQYFAHLPQYAFGRVESDGRKGLFIQKGLQRYFRRPVTRSEAMVMFDVIATYAAECEKNPALIKERTGPLPPVPSDGSGPLQANPAAGSGPLQTPPRGSGSGSDALSGSSAFSTAGSGSDALNASSIFRTGGSGSVTIPMSGMSNTQPSGNDIPDPNLSSTNLMASEAIAGIMGEEQEIDLDVLISMDSTMLEAPDDPAALEELSGLEEQLGPVLDTVGQTIVDLLGVESPSQLQIRTNDRLIIVQHAGTARSVGVTRDLTASARSVARALNSRVSEHTSS